MPITLAILAFLASTTYEAGPVKALVHVHPDDGKLTVAESLKVTITTFVPELSDSQQLETGKKRAYRAELPFRHFQSIPKWNQVESKQTIDGQSAQGRIIDAHSFDLAPELTGEFLIPAFSIPFTSQVPGQPAQTITTEPFTVTVTSVLPSEITTPADAELKPEIKTLPTKERSRFSLLRLLGVIAILGVWFAVRGKYWRERFLGKGAKAAPTRKRSAGDLALRELQNVDSGVWAKRVLRNFAQDEWEIELEATSPEELRKHIKVPVLLRDELADLSERVEAAAYQLDKKTLDEELRKRLEGFFRKVR